MNNPDKFPQSYIYELAEDLRSKISTLTLTTTDSETTFELNFVCLSKNTPLNEKNHYDRYRHFR